MTWKNYVIIAISILNVCCGGFFLIVAVIEGDEGAILLGLIGLIFLVLGILGIARKGTKFGETIPQNPDKVREQMALIKRTTNDPETLEKLRKALKKMEV